LVAHLNGVSIGNEAVGWNLPPRRPSSNARVAFKHLVSMEVPKLQHAP
jgi:hypothetical protein